MGSGMITDMESKTDKLNWSSGLICHVHFCTNALGKGGAYLSPTSFA